MRNEHAIDRVIRVLAGIAAVLAAWFTLGLADGAVLGILALIVGLVLVATGLAGFCPAYRLLGVRTCKATPGGRPEV
jgi:hypothetical protein